MFSGIKDTVRSLMGEKPSDSIQPNEKEVYSTKEVIVPGVKVTRGWTSNEHPIISKSKAIDIKKRADLDAEISYENQIDFAKSVERAKLWEN